MKSKVIFHLEKKFDKILLIKEKINKFKIILINFYRKSMELHGVSKKKHHFFRKRNVCYDPTVNKQFLNNSILSVYHYIPIRLRGKDLIFITNLTKNLNFKILSQSKIFIFQHIKIFNLYQRLKKKNEHGVKTNLTYHSYLCKFNKGKKSIMMKKTLFNYNFKTNYFNFKNFISKKNEPVFINNFLYRFYDLNNECSRLWKRYNKKKNYCKKNYFQYYKYTNFKQKALGKFFLLDNSSKVLFIALYKKIKFFELKIDIVIEKKKALYQKFQELKGMELDFQIFTEFINKYNLIENKII